MRSAIAERSAWYTARYRQSLRHTIEEEHVGYLTDLAKTLKSMVKRRAQSRTGAGWRKIESHDTASP